MELLNQLRLMADYNQLMNQRVYSASRRLSTEELHLNRGAYFKSIIGTLNHIMVGDLIWLQRLSTHPSRFVSLNPVRATEMPTALNSELFSDIYDLWQERQILDSVLVCWMNEITPVELQHPLEYKNMRGQEFRKQAGSLILHIFNHQTHHRGQVTALLSQAGEDVGATDLIEIIAEL